MNDKPKLLYALSTLWALLGLIFLILGVLSLFLAIYILSPESEYSSFYPMLFFGAFFLTTALLVFGCIFVIFAYETYKAKMWAWNAGVIISTIFIVIFSFMLGSIMITALLFRDPYFSIPVLLVIMIVFLNDLGIIFLITRPIIKKFMMT